jgi:hypothetical protein
MGKSVADARQLKLDAERLTSKLSADMKRGVDSVYTLLTDHPEYLDDEGRQLLAARGDATVAQMVRTLEVSHDVYTRVSRDRAAQRLAFEERLRGILQLIASAADEGV